MENSRFNIDQLENNSSLPDATGNKRDQSIEGLAWALMRPTIEDTTYAGFGSGANLIALNNLHKQFKMMQLGLRQYLGIGE